jgi:outer membrane protein TolC
MANNTDIQLQNLTIETPKNAIQRAFGCLGSARGRAVYQHTCQHAGHQPVGRCGRCEDAAAAGAVLGFADPAYRNSVHGGLQCVEGDQPTTPSTPTTGIVECVSINFTQPLLQNRGTYVNRLTLMLSRNSLRVSEYQMRNQIMNLVSQAENAYWDVISARENLRVAESAELTANEFLKLQQRQLELGALSPLDIYAQQQQVAQRKVDTAQARFQLALVEDTLRKQMGADMDPDVRKLPVVLTETVEMPLDNIVIDRDATIEKAMLSRPDLKSALQNLDGDDLRIQHPGTRCCRISR